LLTLTWRFPSMTQSGGETECRTRIRVFPSINGQQTAATTSF
jgi:hypothetical protein